MAQLRSNSHRFNIETGRHVPLRHAHFLNCISKFCQYCDEDALRNFAELTFLEPVNEDEVHVLQTCPSYNQFAESFNESLRACFFTDLAAYSKSEAMY